MIRNGIIATLIAVIVTEVLLFIVDYVWTGNPLNFWYLLIPIMYCGFQTVFILNVKDFLTDKSGIKYFFLYKGVKFFTVVAFILLYAFIAKEPDKWIPIRVIIYYFEFLVMETVLSTKIQKTEKR
ncbi:MAG: hypothetical protein MJ003_01205 [Paludibacteraceae bacterium]|nr:hypothetical protein [Paludibacteraceae bacterium]